MQQTAKSKFIITDYGEAWTPQFPELGTGPVPVEPYISQAVFDDEVEKVFKKAWIYVGRATQIPNAGDYFVVPFPAAHTSLLIARGQDGKIRAFHNVCKHRSNRVVWDEQGNCKGFACKYHGWVYNLDGSLRTVPGEERFFELDKPKLGLTEIACDDFESLVFVNLAPKPDQSLSDFLGEWGQGMRGYRFDDFSRTYVVRGQLKANWKIVMDAFHENYHFKFIHRRTAGGPFTTPDYPFGKLFAFHLFPYHRRMSAASINSEYVPPPVMLASLMPWSTEEAPAYVPLSDDQLPSGVNPARAPDWLADINVAFPNTLIQPFRNRFLTYSFIPVDLETSIFELGVHCPPPKTVAQEFALEAQNVFLRDIFLEDLSNCEHIQEVIGSGAIKEFQVQDMELLIRHSNKALADYIAAH